MSPIENERGESIRWIIKIKMNFCVSWMNKLIIKFRNSCYTEVITKLFHLPFCCFFLFLKNSEFKNFYLVLKLERMLMDYENEIKQKTGKESKISGVLKNKKVHNDFHSTTDPYQDSKIFSSLLFSWKTIQFMWSSSHITCVSAHLIWVAFDFFVSHS